ncbi:hypothetical protein YB2330_002777 [Saitoella coloradoensis]
MGDSGAVAYFAPANGQNGSLGLSSVNGTTPGGISPFNASFANLAITSSNSSDASIQQHGASGFMYLNNTATLSVAILGSLRTIRDFTEGPSILVPEIQDAVQYTALPSGSGVRLTRTWLDNVTVSTLQFEGPGVALRDNSDGTHNVTFEAGTYEWSAGVTYPELHQFTTTEVLNERSQALANNTLARYLAYLAFHEKLVAGTWRFLTYFGRDSLISLLLLNPVLSNDVIEAGIGAILERENSTGALCHEETIGDYATYLNQQQKITSIDPMYDYKMVDTDFYLQPLLAQYFFDTPVGVTRSSAFLATTATNTTNPANANQTYQSLIIRNAQLIMNSTAPFVSTQSKDNLIHLREGQIVGQWRDSTYGIGGGRVPYDVNTALVPAALRAIGRLARVGFIGHGMTGIGFFRVNMTQEESMSRLAGYVNASSFAGPDNAELIGSDGVTFHGLALDGNNNQSVVEVMNSDDCFRHFLLNTTNDDQLTSFMNQTASNLNREFPAGLLTSAGMLVADPAFGGDPVYAANWTRGAYHGTVIWSWQMAMMAAGLERQLARLYPNVVSAYSNLWDVIEGNAAQLSQEVWSWEFKDGGFEVVPLSDIPAPGGIPQTESDSIQLWSLTFLAVQRNPTFA